MNAFLQIWRREIAALFRTSVAYVVGVFFLLVSGFNFWMLAARLARGAQDGDMAGLLFGSPLYWLSMLIVTPLLTMRLFAEEQRMGTLDLLLAAPVTEAQVVLGKFAAALSAFLLLWVPTLSYAFLLEHCGASLPPLDWGPVAAGYLGTALVGACFLATGLLCSLLTRHQVVAAMVCLAALGLLLAAGQLPYDSHTEQIRLWARAISPPLHLQDFAAGVLDSRTLTGYLGATVLLLFISVRLLEARRLR